MIKRYTKETVLISFLKSMTADRFLIVFLIIFLIAFPDRFGCIPAVLQLPAYFRIHHTPKAAWKGIRRIFDTPFTSLTGLCRHKCRSRSQKTGAWRLALLLKPVSSQAQAFDIITQLQENRQYFS